MSAGTRSWTVRLTAAAEADFEEVLRLLHDAMDLQRHLPPVEESS